MKLLLSGASGFFGSNLVDRLVGPSGDPTAGVETGIAGRFDARLDLHIVQRGSVCERPGVTAHRADLLDSEAVGELMSALRPTHLCHMAWLGPEHQDRYRSPENARWAEASKHLFNAFRDAGGQRLVHVGSCIEYGNAHTGVRVESQPLAADTAYGAAKADVAEHVARLGNDLSTAVARPFFSYGPHEQPERLVSSLILALNRGEAIDLTEGRQRRDYIDARDVAAAIWTLIASDVTGPYNIGTGSGVAVRSIAEHLGRIAGRPELLRFGARPEGADSAAEIVADITRLTSATNWKPSIGLEQGLQDATEWWLRRRETQQQAQEAQAPAGGADK